jgi:hypothetical protein
MRLKPVLNETEWKGLPPAIQECYVKSGDHYAVDVDEKEYTSKVKEFRDNNVALAQKRDDLQTALDKFKDVDLDKYARAMEELTKLEEIEDGELLKKGKTGAEQLVNKRLATKEKAFADKLKLVETERDTAIKQSQQYKGLHGKLLVETTGISHINNIAVPRKNAMPLLTGLLHENFMAGDDGKLVPREGKTTAKGEPLTMEEFGKTLLADHAYLFEAATGGGAGGGNKKTGVAGNVQVIDRDPLSFGQNADSIAKGTTVVRQNE